MPRPLLFCRGGGIGRRAGFRCQCPLGRGGSSPLLGTIPNLSHAIAVCRGPVCQGIPAPPFAGLAGSRSASYANCRRPALPRRRNFAPQARGSHAVQSVPQGRGGGIGRRARFRSWWEFPVEVRVLSSAPSRSANTPARHCRRVAIRNNPVVSFPPSTRPHRGRSPAPDALTQ